MKDAKVCKKGTVKIKGKCYPGIKTGKLTIVKMAGDLQIYRGTPSIDNFRGSILEGEENWQPPSIQVYPDVSNAIQLRIHNALTKQASPADALTALAADLQTIVNK
jgi:hypothetical protein